ncbi:MAG: cell division protein FtsQ/DivIB [Desulfosudaceae bacterium]
MNKRNRKMQQPVVLAQRQPVRRNRKKGKKPARSFRTGFRLAGSFSLMAGVLVISAFFVGGYLLLTGCDCLGISNVSVAGTCLLEEEAVVRQAGIQRGNNILAVNLAAARKRLLAHPWIASVGISRQLPDTVAISIQEYEPLTVVDLGREYFIDEQRTLFKSREVSDPQGLPVISGLDYRDLDEQGRPGSELFRAALDVIETGRRLRHLIPGLSIDRVAVDRDRGVTLYAFDRVGPVRFGFDDDQDHYVKKYKRLNDVLSCLDDRAGDVRVAAVGLECPGRVVVRMRDRETEVAFGGQPHKGG